MAWTTSTDPTAFLDAAEDFLRAEPVRETIALSVATALRAGRVYGDGVPEFGWWRPTGGGEVGGAWLRSRLTVAPVSESVADLAARLLEDTGLDGHECVVGALVVATAASAHGQVKVASSDASHIPELCDAASFGRASRVQWVRV